MRKKKKKSGRKILGVEKCDQTKATSHRAEVINIFLKWAIILEEILIIIKEFKIILVWHFKKKKQCKILNMQCVKFKNREHNQYNYFIVIKVYI